MPTDLASLAPSKPTAIAQDEGKHHQETEAVHISTLFTLVKTRHATLDGSRHRMVQYLRQLIIGVMGKEYTLRTPSNEQLQKAMHLAEAYAHCLFRGTAPRPEIATLSATLNKLRIHFSRTELQRLALADAQDFTFTEAQLTRGITDLRPPPRVPHSADYTPQQ